MEVSCQHHDLTASSLGKNPVPFEKEVGWALEPVWGFLEARKSVAPTGIKTLDLSARSTVVPTTLRPKVRSEIPAVKKFKLFNKKGNCVRPA